MPNADGERGFFAEREDELVVLDGYGAGAFVLAAVFGGDVDAVDDAASTDKGLFIWVERSVAAAKHQRSQERGDKD